jgi:putative ABC transport system substrate-binding protein
MRRREFITLLGGSAAWPFAAWAQQRSPRPARIGYLSAASRPDVNIDSFRIGMHGLGYVEGRDFVIQARYAERNFSRFPILVEELLRANVEVIVTGGPATQAATLAGRSVPVVFGFSGNPVDAGVVGSYRAGTPPGSRFSRSILRPSGLKSSGRQHRAHGGSRYCRIPSTPENRPSWR